MKKQVSTNAIENTPKNASGSIFLRFWLPTWPPGGVRELTFRAFLHLGPVSGPRWPPDPPKEPPRHLPTSIWSHFCLKIDGFGPKIGKTTDSIPPSTLPLPVTSVVEFCRQCIRKSRILEKNGQRSVLPTTGLCCQSCRQCTRKSQTLGHSWKAIYNAIGSAA